MGVIWQKIILNSFLIFSFLACNSLPISTRFQDLPMGDLWEEALLRDACRYVRGNIHLRVPPKWKAVFPSSL